MNKEELILFAKKTYEKKLLDLENNIAEVQKSANEESKSSMGDKYETGRAMAQSEVFMLQNQKENFSKELGTFNSIVFIENLEKVILGSLIQTEMGWFLLSAGLGKLVFKGKVFMCISQNSPLGQVLLGKEKGQTFTVNGRKSTVLSLI